MRAAPALLLPLPCCTCRAAPAQPAHVPLLPLLVLLHTVSFNNKGISDFRVESLAGISDSVTLEVTTRQAKVCRLALLHTWRRAAY